MSAPYGMPIQVGRDDFLYTNGAVWQAADDGGWLPGIYADEAAARKALEVVRTHYRALAAAVDADVRGIGDDYRPVTVADLEAISG